MEPKRIAGLVILGCSRQLCLEHSLYARINLCGYRIPCSKRDCLSFQQLPLMFTCTHRYFVLSADASDGYIKKVEAKRGHRINRFFSFVNHPAKPIYLFIILSLILGIFSYANAVHMVTTEYAVSVPETNKKTEKMVIAFIADCHLGSATDQNQWIKLVDKINDMQPDLLILGGDIVDNNTPDSYYTLLTDTLGRLQPAFGKFCVEGDNEAEQTNDYAEQMEKAGVTFLKDQTAYLYNQYRLIGLRDMSDKDKILPSSYLEQIKKDSPLYYRYQPPAEKTGGYCSI